MGQACLQKKEDARRYGTKTISIPLANSAGERNPRALPTWHIHNQLTHKYIQALHGLTKGKPDLNTPEFWDSLDEKKNMAPVQFSLQPNAQL